MNLLLTFDSTPFIRHLTKVDDPRMVDFIIREYGAALQAAISFYGGGVTHRIQAHYQEAYFKTILSHGNAYLDEEGQGSTWRSRVIDEEGNVQSSKARYDELVDLCIELFNQQCVAVLRGILSQARKIYTVDVLGYDNRTLKILLKTDGVVVP